MAFAEDDLTSDAFLGGALTLLQPSAGYRAGIDPVLLAAAVPARSGESVLELGCGAGAAILCLGRRVLGLRLTGLEVQPDYADLARRNAEANGIDAEVLTADLRDMPAALRAQSFDHVIANPPYFRRAAGTAAAVAGRETALGEDLPLRAWIETGLRRTKPKGRLTMIQRADRLGDVVAVFDGLDACLSVLPVVPRAGRDATLVLVRAIKGGKSPFRLCAPLVLHAGTQHSADGDDYTPGVTAVLRRGAALPWGSDGS